MNLNARPLIAILGGRNLPQPGQSWNLSRFIKSGAEMIVALHRVAQISQRRQGRILAPGLARILNSQVEMVITRATRGRKAEIDVSDHEALWAAAMEDVFRETQTDIAVEVGPSIQKVLAQGYARTNILLGQEDLTASAVLAREARNLASEVTRINETTRKTIAKIVRQGLADGLSVTETADVMRTVLPQVNSTRAFTIARNEMANAWTQGSVRSFQQSDTLTHVSVVGCQSREEELWTKPEYQEFLYRGESTCNAQDIPVYDAHTLKWHINHSGTLVPSAFRD